MWIKITRSQYLGFVLPDILLVVTWTYAATEYNRFLFLDIFFNLIS